ncbi:MAG: hypothetical protein HQL41_04330 [Alphaproteobacteria bacterium]|nr:hypothetical protein [Alphaproteobacteria bacterium]
MSNKLKGRHGGGPLGVGLTPECGMKSPSGEQFGSNLFIAATAGESVGEGVSSIVSTKLQV